MFFARFSSCAWRYFDDLSSSFSSSSKFPLRNSIYWFKIARVIVFFFPSSDAASSISFNYNSVVIVIFLVSFIRDILENRSIVAWQRMILLSISMKEPSFYRNVALLCSNLLFAIIFFFLPSFINVVFVSAFLFTLLFLTIFPR